MICEHCGKEARPGDLFCRRCGARLPAEAGPAAGDPSGETPQETFWEPPGEGAAAGSSEGGSDYAAEGPGPASGEGERPGAEAWAAPGEAAKESLLPPTPPAAPVPPYPQPPRPGTAAVKTSGWAVASLVLGILSFTCLPFIAAVLAIVFGAIARSDIKRSGGKTGGSGLATAGIVLGVVNLAILLVFVAVLVPWTIMNLGNTKTITRTVAIQGAQSVSASIEIDSGNLDVSGGAGDMFEGTFTYNVKRWEPEIDYTVRDEVGELSVKQGGEWWVPALWFIRNDWDLRFSDDVPLDLAAELSSGNGDFDLKALDMRSLSVDASSGDVNADLSGDMPELRRVNIDSSSGDVDLVLKGTYRTYIQMDVENSSGDISVNLLGEWKSTLGATISSSSGDVTLHLPEEVGVRARVRSRSGDVNAPGMTVDSRDGDGAVYVNESFRRSLITLQIDVEVSSGDVTLLLE
jgi:hypothetical protein